MDHLGITVTPTQFDATVAWYLAALAPLGYTRTRSFPGVAGLGIKRDAHFWIATKENITTVGMHLAFKAKDQETVDKFHEEGIKAGGKDNGKPGIRTMYSPTYYGGFVLDPNG